MSTEGLAKQENFNKRFWLFRVAERNVAEVVNCSRVLVSQTESLCLQMNTVRNKMLQVKNKILQLHLIIYSRVSVLVHLPPLTLLASDSCPSLSFCWRFLNSDVKNNFFLPAITMCCSYEVVWCDRLRSFPYYVGCLPYNTKRREATLVVSCRITMDLELNLVESHRLEDLCFCPNRKVI